MFIAVDTGGLTQYIFPKLLIFSLLLLGGKNTLFNEHLLIKECLIMEKTTEMTESRRRSTPPNDPFAEHDAPKSILDAVIT